MTEPIFNAKSFAATLNGREYLEETTKVETAIAKVNNLVIAYGQSDDLLEFRGAINDELGAWNGAEVCIANGKAIHIEEVEANREILRKYGYDFSSNITVKAVWCPPELDASWLISVEGVEGHSFDILEDGRLYCRGVVFELDK